MTERFWKRISKFKNSEIKSEKRNLKSIKSSNLSKFQNYLCLLKSQSVLF